MTDDQTRPQPPQPPSTPWPPEWDAAASSGRATSSAGTETGSAASYPASASFPATGPAPAPRRASAQFGTIAWGMLLLALCGFVALTVFGPGVVADQYLWAFIGVIVVGAALVAVGIAAAFRR